MSTKLAKIIADFTTQLSSVMQIGATSATLQSQTDDDGNAIPDGAYFFTLDGANASKEHIFCIKTGLNIASVFSVSRQGIQTSGVMRKHRIGASVTITDFAHIAYINQILEGIFAADSTSPLFYDANFSPTLGQFQIPTWDFVKAYADALTISGSPDASTILKGIGKITVAPATTLGNPTISIASPAVVTLAAHTLIAGDSIKFSTSGSLPTGISAGSTYYVLAAGLTANAFEISVTPGGTPIVTSGTQSPTHTLIRTTPFFVGNDDPRLVPALVVPGLQTGTSGAAISTSNHVVDAADVSNAGASNKIVRMNGTQYPAGDGSLLTGLDLPVETYPLGEAFTGATTPQPAVLINDIAQPLVNDAYIIGGATNLASVRTNKLAVSIIPRENITAQSITAYLAKQNSPSGNVTVEIQTDNSGAPSNTPITNGTSNNLAASGITPAFALKTLTFASPFALVAGTKYWVVFKESDNSDTDNILIEVSTNTGNVAATGGNYASFVGMKALTTTWSSSDNQAIPCFQIIQTSGPTSLSLWRAVAGLSNQGAEALNNFAGFVVTTGGAGATGTLIRGNIPGFALLGYQDYYVSSSIGTVTTDPTQGGIYVGTTNIGGTILITKFDKQLGVAIQRGWGAFNSQNTIAQNVLIPRWTAQSDGFVYGAFAVSGSGALAFIIGSTTYNLQVNGAGTWGIPYNFPVRKGENVSLNNGAYYWRANL